MQNILGIINIMEQFAVEILFRYYFAEQFSDLFTLNIAEFSSIQLWTKWQIR